MASRRLLSRHTLVPAAAGLLASTTLTHALRPSTAHADSPFTTSNLPPATQSPEAYNIPSTKKPIYDSDGGASAALDAAAAAALAAPSTTSPAATGSASPAPTSDIRTLPAAASDPPGFFDATRPDAHDTGSTSTRGPTPTDRLTGYVRTGRLQLYRFAAASERGANEVLARALRLESSVTATVASLAPPASAKEPLVPGLVYVLVATMAGSIVTRNRGFLLRATVPLAFGVGAANVVLPVTAHNVGQLVWEYERRFPVVADTHERVQERVERFWETGKAHTAMGVQMAEQKVGEAKRGVEDWVKKGG